LRSLSEIEQHPHLLIKRRKGRLVAVARGGRRTWRVVAECLAMTGVSCSILACGCEAGFYSKQRMFNAQSQRFAEVTMKAVIPRWTSEASNAGAAPERVADRRGESSGLIHEQQPASLGGVLKGCFGQSRLELFNPAGFVFANYVCEVETKDGLIAANLGLRRDPDAWRITGLYVDDQVRPRQGA